MWQCGIDVFVIINCVIYLLRSETSVILAVNVCVYLAVSDSLFIFKKCDFGRKGFLLTEGQRVNTYNGLPMELLNQ